MPRSEQIAGKVRLAYRRHLATFVPITIQFELRAAWQDATKTAAQMAALLCMFETVNYDFEIDVATVRMNRPDALNALSLQLSLDLRSAFEKAIADGARAVVLTGSGRAFCSGGDLREMQSMWKTEGRIEAFLDEPLKALHDAILLIRETPIPFVAAVNGVCAGAGTNFALACDLVIAADDASFNEAFVRIGLSPDCGGTFSCLVPSAKNSQPSYL